MTTAVGAVDAVDAVDAVAVAGNDKFSHQQREKGF